jgi:hypothetical protein
MSTLVDHQPLGQGVALVGINDLAACHYLGAAGRRLAEHRYGKPGRRASSTGRQRRHDRVEMGHVEQESEDPRVQPPLGPQNQPLAGIAIDASPRCRATSLRPLQ